MMADTHLQHKFKVPDGDILLHAGDGMNYGTIPELNRFAGWMRSLPHRYKILIAGNHDWPFQRDGLYCRGVMADAGVVYLQDEQAVIEGLRIYGSPWQPEFCGWAFNLPRGGYRLKQKWDNIPDRLDFLITHGPPAQHCSLTDRGEDVGCGLLLTAVEKKRPKHHLFGHIHNGYGISQNKFTNFYNVSVCDEAYQPVHPVTVIDV